MYRFDLDSGIGFVVSALLERLTGSWGMAMPEKASLPATPQIGLRIRGPAQKISQAELGTRIGVSFQQI